MRWAEKRRLPLLLAATLTGIPALSFAQNAEFQNFFFAVCGGATVGALTTRCGETPGGTGNVSGDSEESLNKIFFTSGCFLNISLPVMLFIIVTMRVTDIVGTP